MKLEGQLEPNQRNSTPFPSLAVAMAGKGKRTLTGADGGEGNGKGLISDGREGNGKGKAAAGQGKGRAFEVTD
jgi:hypothetical protein